MKWAGKTVIMILAIERKGGGGGGGGRFHGAKSISTNLEASGKSLEARTTLLPPSSPVLWREVVEGAGEGLNNGV